MQLVFLSARLPLTKTFVSNNGAVQASPYPHVSKVTSHHETVTTINDFHAKLLLHASAGNCLFGGELEQPLDNESRAGRTLKRDRTWVVFDFDRVAASDHTEVVAKYLPPECQNVSYIAQLSASMWRPDVKHWSGHIFMMLKEPKSETYIKQWVESLNFSLPALASQITLSDSLQALHWPLDRAANYCSKLIYIAPPKVFGYTPTIKNPIALVKKRNPSLAVNAFVPLDTVTIRQKINDMRRAAGLDEIEYATRIFEGEEVLLKSGEVTIHGLKASGDHYIRFNLNGGDSYAYFVDLRNPALIKNFKGEPFLKTEDAAPELWTSLRHKAPQIIQRPPLDDGDEVLAFYATNKGSKIHVGTHSPTKRKVTLNMASETSARAWLSEFGVHKKGFLPHHNLIFDPTTDVQYVPGAIDINQFSPTKYMGRNPMKTEPSTLLDIPTLAEKIMRSMLGDPTDEVFGHFMNWLAVIFKTRKKTGTAWILHGRTGTGKGSFIKYFLRPLFGDEYVRTINLPLVTSQFNAWIESALFVIVEESDVHSVDNSADAHAKLLHYISDEIIEINQKGVGTYAAKTYANFLFNTNKRTPATITKDDRRFNIAERQEKRLFFTPNELQALAAGVELDAFADVLERWPIDEGKAAMVIETSARSDVHEATTSINQLIAEAVMSGDLQYFVDRMPSETEAVADSRMGQRFNPLSMYRTLIDTYIDAAKRGKSTIVTEDDLFILFRTMIPDERFFQDSKVWRRRHFKGLGLDVDKRVRHPDDWKVRERGVVVKWRMPEDLPEHVDTTNVKSIKRGRK